MPGLVFVSKVLYIYLPDCVDRYAARNDIEERRTMKKTIAALCAGAALAFVLGSVPAFANGGDFFNELSESWGANSDTGTPYFGYFRDAEGQAIARAIVTANPQDD